MRRTAGRQPRLRDRSSLPTSPRTPTASPSLNSEKLCPRASIRSIPTTTRAKIAPLRIQSVPKEGPAPSCTGIASSIDTPIYR